MRIADQSKYPILVRIIFEYIKEHGYSPSYRDIIREMVPYNHDWIMSTSHVAYYLSLLVGKEYITKVTNLPRSLSITDKGKKLIGVANYPDAYVYSVCPHCGKKLDNPPVQPSNYFILDDEMKIGVTAGSSI